MEQESIKLLSNIMLKSRVNQSKDGSISYLPFDLMPEEYGDVRNERFLSEYQRMQKLKSMFAAKHIIDDNSKEKNDDEVVSKQISHSTKVKTIKENARNKSKAIISNEAPLDTIPEELRENAMDLLVKGVFTGWFTIVPYDGSVKDYTDKKTETLHLLVMRKGRQKKVPVSVVHEDGLIYIREELLKLYEKEFGTPNGVEITRLTN